MSDDDEFDIAKPPKPRTPATREGVTPAQRYGADEFDIANRPTVPVMPGPRESPVGIDWTRFNQPKGELKPTDENWTQWAKWKLMGGLDYLGVKPSDQRHLVGSIFGHPEAPITVGPLDFSPGAPVLSGANAVYNAQRGNYGTAAFDVLGATPALGWIRSARAPARDLIQTAERPVFEGQARTVKGERVPSDYESNRFNPYIAEKPGTAIPWTFTREAGGAERRQAREAAMPQGTAFPNIMPPGMFDAARAQYRAIETFPHQFHPDAMGDATRRILGTLQYNTPFSPEAAAPVYQTLQRFNQNFPGNRIVGANDFNVLRDQLKGLSGTHGPAVRRAVEELDNYIVNPPHGMMVGDWAPGARGGMQLVPRSQALQDELATLGQNIVDSRGNYRAAMTASAPAEAVDYAHQSMALSNSGKNINRVRQKVGEFTTSPAGEAKLFGARPSELEAIAEAARGNTASNAQRTLANMLGSGGGAWLGMLTTGAAGAGGWAASHFGAPAWGAMLAAGGAGSIPYMAGNVLRNASAANTERAVHQAVNQIAANSPLYQARLAATGLHSSPPVEPSSPFIRDMLATAITQQAANQGKDYWNTESVPYELRGQQ